MKYSEICSRCGKDVCNGIGGDETPRLNKFLQSLPSSHLFYNASVGHDLRYHKLELKLRKLADDYFLQDMLEACETKPFYSRWFWKLQAFRNYFFVREFGEKFFDGPCKQ